MCGCLPALRRGLPAIVAGLRLAISAVVVLSLNVLGKLISLPAPASRFAFPGQAVSANTPDKRRINASAYSSRDNHAITARFTHGGDNCPAQYSAVNNPPTGRCTRRLCACRQAASAISSASSLSPRRRNTGGR